MASSNREMASRSCSPHPPFNAAKMSTTANLSTNRDDPRTLVVVFLRGAADGLTLVAPVADDNYHKARPRLAVKKSAAMRLDDTLGLHPNLRALEAAWKENDLAVIHGA